MIGIVVFNLPSDVSRGASAGAIAGTAITPEEQGIRLAYPVWGERYHGLLSV